MNLNIVYILLVTILVTGNDRDFSFEEEFIIGMDQDNLEAILGNPLEIRTGSDGSIYIPDRQTATVKVYTREGNYSHKIGQQGRGPGDFAYYPVIEISGQDELVAFDGANWQVSHFSTDGELLSTDVPERENMVWPKSVRQIENDRYILLRKLNDRNLSEDYLNEEERHLYSSFFHVIDHSFSERVSSFGLLSEILESDSEFIKQYLTQQPGHFWPAESGEIWYVPAIYDGRIFRFANQENRWGLQDVHRGRLITEEVITQASANPDGHPSFEGAIAITLLPEGESFAGRINSYSLGIFELQDQRFMHLSSQISGDERVMAVELFTKEGEYLSHGILPGFSVSATSQYSGIGHIWMDEEDRIYMIDRRNDVPIIRVGRITGI